MKFEAIKAVVFDYGATLDTNGVHWYHIFASEWTKHFPTLADEALREAYVYAERSLAAKKLVAKTDTFHLVLQKKIDLQAEYLIEKGLLASVGAKQRENLVEGCYSVPLTCTAKAKEVLDKLGSRFRLALISNFYGNILSVLDEFGLKSYFEAITESASVGLSKPDPKLYEHCLDCLQLKGEECVMVGDSYPKDIVPAKKLGFHTVWLKGKGWQEEKRECPMADEVILSLEELTEK